jgi:hypothetical protein
MALGDSADTVEIPDTTPAGEGIPSFTSLFPILTQIDPTAGGVFIQRTWMNALFQLLGNNIWFLQHGCLFPWNSSFDYPSGAHVLGSDSHEYVAVQESTGEDPTQDDDATYWARTASSPDGVTIVNAASGKLTAQDVAIGGDTSDLASARGFFYDTYVPWWGGSAQAAYAVTDFNEFTTPGIYHVRWREGSPYTDTADVTWPVTLNNPNVAGGAGYWIDGILEVSQVSSVSYTSSWPRLQHRLFVTSTANGEIGKTYTRVQTVTSARTWSSWSSPERDIRLAMIGMIAPFASTNLPEGWMACDGSSVLFADWPEFQTAYNAGRFSGMTVSSSTPAQVGKLVTNGTSGVYLPDLVGLFVQASASGTAGAYVAPGLPNITGHLQGGDTSGVTIWAHTLDEGALSSVQNSKSYATPAEQTQEFFDIDFNASRSNPIYSDAVNTVQPPTVQFIMAMYLGKPAA